MWERWTATTALFATVVAVLGGAPNAAADPVLGIGKVSAVEALAPAAVPPGSASSERIRYGSTTMNGRPATASAAVYFPPGKAPAGGWPVIAWAHGSVGLGDQCAYSVVGPAVVDRDWAYLGAWLKQGYAIVAADYAGLGTPGDHPYLNGRVVAHNIVDAVKAATGHYSSLAKKWVVVGQSQGGSAAVSTARYATEFGGSGLDYRGAVSTGVAADAEKVLLTLGPGVPPVKLPPHTTTYLLYMINGFRTTYPELNIDLYLNDSGRYWLERANTSCLEPFSKESAANSVIVGNLFARPLAEIPDLPERLARAMSLPESGYDKPLFMGHGLLDTDVITPATLAFAARMKAAGQPVTLHTYPTDHNGAVNASLHDSIPFVRSRFA